MSRIFEVFDYDQALKAGGGGEYGRRDTKGFSGAFHAIAIDPRSEQDAVYVDGQVVCVGAPLYLDGSLRQYAIDSYRHVPGNARLVGVLDPCGLAALPMHRTPYRYQELPHTSLTYQWRFPVGGRRHWSIAVTSDLADTIEIQGWRIDAAGDAFVKDHIYEAAVTSNTDNVGMMIEVGGTNEEECYDQVVINVGGAGSVARELWFEAYGELGR